jgi:alpha-ketoglutarate-dependent taurine dioxygenase
MMGIETDAAPAAAEPLTVIAAESVRDAVRWAAERREQVRAGVECAGAVLLRGLGVCSHAETAAVAAALGLEPMTEREGFAPRTGHPGTVYSSSHWPQDEPMCMHHELSYTAEPPGTLLFACLAAPASGGRTAVADGRLVLRDLPAGLVAPFEREGWLLTRMYHEVGVRWQDAFGTEDPRQVDEYCAAAGLECAWLPDGRLRTRQRRSAVLRHPRTGIPAWFNQIAFLNGLTMDPPIRQYLLDVYGPQGLPFDTAYADGSPIDLATVETINAVYDAHTVAEPWQTGDVLVVDNLRMAHNREIYEGDREIAVVLADPARLDAHVLPVAGEGR